MNWDKAYGELAAAGEIVADWRDGAQVAEIERDIVLEKLRAVYEAVKVGAVTEADEPARAEVVPCVPDPEVSVPESSVEEECALEVSIPETPAQEMPACETVAEMAADEICGSGVLQEDGAAGDVILEIDRAVETSGESRADCVKAKIDRRALLSLYDDDCPTESPAVQASERVQERIGGVQPTHERGGEIKPQPVPVTSIPKEPVKVWGEMAGNGGQTIADAYAGNVHDVASAIGGGPVESLRQAIGVNDRFLMIRDMFDADADAYERAMEKFESFGDLDDAMVYIYENYSWNPDDEGVKLLVDLLTRKLS